MGFFDDAFDGFTGKAAKNAANAQQEGIAAADTRLVDSLGTVRGLLDPGVESGNQSRNALLDILGLSGQDSQQAAFDNFQTTPGFQFGLEQGINAVDQSGAARGQLNSGATLKALQDRGNSLANQEFGNHTNNLFRLLDNGTNATNNLVSAESTTGANRANLSVGAGNANAQGIIGSANAATGSINNLIDLATTAAKAAAGVPPGLEAGAGGLF